MRPFCHESNRNSEMSKIARVVATRKSKNIYTGTLVVLIFFQENFVYQRKI